MNTYSTYSDEQLLQLLQAGDEPAFKEIYHRYSNRLSENAIRITGNFSDAGDVVQELFISLWNNRSQLVIRSSLVAYLDTGVRYGCFRMLSNASRHRAKLAAIGQYLATNTVQPDLDTKELEQRIDSIVKTLPERTREVFILSRNHQLSHREISQKLDIAEDTSRQHIKNALRLIRHQLNIISSLLSLLVFVRFCYFSDATLLQVFDAML